MHYYPTPYPCVVKEALLQVRRELARDGKILVEPGQRVAADEVVAIGRLSDEPTIIDAASELNVAPGEVLKGLTREIGEAVKAGDLLVSVRVGLRKKEIKASHDGTVVSVDAVSGQLQFMPTEQQQELKAYVAGVIDHVDGRRAVTISSTASRLHGIWGQGGETVGVLRMASSNREGDLRAESLDARAALSVVVAGRTATADALKKAATVGVRAVVLGSLEEAEYRAFLESLGKVSPRWFVGGPSWEFPSPHPLLPFTIIVTEGIGRLAMAPEAFDTLAQCEGREVSLRGTTRLRGQLLRPEIIIPTTSRGETRPTAVPASSLQVGTRVRLVDPRHLGQLGAVAQPPALRPAGDGVLLDMVGIDLDAGGRRLIPVVNVEVLA